MDSKMEQCFDLETSEWSCHLLLFEGGNELDYEKLVKPFGYLAISEEDIMYGFGGVAAQPKKDVVPKKLEARQIKTIYRDWKNSAISLGQAELLMFQSEQPGFEKWTVQFTSDNRREIHWVRIPKS